MKMLENEKIILESDTKEFILTTCRVRQEIKTGGNKQLKSILLEELDSCSIKYKSRLSILILGIVLALLGLVFNKPLDGAGITGIFIGIILGAIYYFTRSIVIYLSSKKEAITINAKSVGFEKSKELIDSVEEAKNNRYHLKK
ncbi:MAG: hypothetical protein JXI43_05795 [Tissierellales bacterium]|nr:hypothetical protein [Tissierellales bacterium]